MYVRGHFNTCVCMIYMKSTVLNCHEFLRKPGTGYSCLPDMISDVSGFLSFGVTVGHKCCLGGYSDAAVMLKKNRNYVYFGCPNKHAGLNVDSLQIFMLWFISQV